MTNRRGVCPRVGTLPLQSRSPEVAARRVGARSLLAQASLDGAGAPKLADELRDEHLRVRLLRDAPGGLRA